MRKKDFVKFYADMYEIDVKDASKDIEEFLETMKTVFSEDSKVVFKNFGIFEVRKTKARYIVDPRNQIDIIHSKPRKYVKFRTSKNMEKLLSLK